MLYPASVCVFEFVFLFILPGLVLVFFCLPQPSLHLFLVSPNYLVLFFIDSPSISCLYLSSLVAFVPHCVLGRTYLCVLVVPGLVSYVLAWFWFPCLVYE
ncbi:hypothetical protein XENORESO_010306 [Xenotaenia resolanae]|uniref:NADH dehydrogenase subunit 6 n=1 Tax=Xenotaenia resolanae TaxID=208358 RepID=A0ABV0W4X3_9TELE